jgi:anti-anti-sigma regulatory factor
MEPATADTVLPALKPGLLAPGPVSGDRVLDASAVERVDLAGLQLLLLAQRECAAAGHALVLKHPSAALSEVLALLGLDMFFTLESGTERPRWKP